MKDALSWEIQETTLNRSPEIGNSRIHQQPYTRKYKHLNEKSHQ